MSEKTHRFVDSTFGGTGLTCWGYVALSFCGAKPSLLVQYGRVLFADGCNVGSEESVEDNFKSIITQS